MIFTRFTPVCAAALTTLLSGPAFASAMNEYTLSPAEMAKPMVAQSAPVRTITTQPAPAALPMVNVGEILFDAQPGQPAITNSTLGTTTMQPQAISPQPTMIQPLQPLGTN